jgi:hypothetical protein
LIDWLAHDLLRFPPCSSLGSCDFDDKVLIPRIMLSCPPKVSISLFVLNLPHRLVAAGMVNIDLLPLLAQLYLMVGKQLVLL